MNCDSAELVIKTTKSSMKYCNEAEQKFVSLFVKQFSISFLRKVPSDNIQNLRLNITISTFGNESDHCEKSLRKCGDFCLHSSVPCPNCLQRNGFCKVDYGKISVRPNQIFRLMVHTNEHTCARTLS